jgi:5-methylcytosine-specific restriction enzyme subunit McrC
VKIPIRNVYYLLCYAWHHAQAKELGDVAEEDFSTLPDLLGHALTTAFGRILRRGLDRNYVAREEEVPGVRGRIDLSVTLARNLAPRARTFCRFDELDYDILPNRIVKATLQALACMDGLDGGLRNRAALLYRKLDAVSDIRLRTGHFRRVQVHRNNRLYDFVLRLCRLIHDHVSIDEETGRTRFHDFRRDEAKMWQLFEDFVFAFYRQERPDFEVHRPQLRWNAVSSEEDARFLPVMRTDVVLEAADRAFIIDLKYYEKPLDRRHDQPKVHAGHLYQVNAYLESWAARGDRPPAEAVLLYPVVEAPFSLRYQLNGRAVRVASVDLGRRWEEIHGEMMRLVD